MTALEDLVQAGGDIHQFFSAADIAANKAYRHPLFVKMWFDTAFAFVEYLLILGLGWNRWLLGHCRRATGALAARLKPGLAQRLALTMDRAWKGPGWGAACLFVVLYQALDLLLLLPESIYFDWYREKQFGMTNQALGGYLGDLMRVNAVHLAGVLCVSFGLYGLIRWFPRRWWLVIGTVGVAGVLASGFFDASRSDLLYEKHPLEPGPVRSAVEAVVAKAKVTVKDVVVINMSRTTNAGDAYFAGQGPTREIVIYDTMLRDFTPGEIAFAVGHEIGHLRESIWSRKLISALAMVPLLYLFQLALVWGARTKRLGFDEVGDIAGLPLLFLLFFVLTFACNPIANTAQRAREEAADAVGLELTHDPESFASLFVKLTKQNKGDPIPEGWVESWLMDHPAVARRLATSLRYRAQLASAGLK